MTEEIVTDKKLSRRQFVGTAAAGAVALGAVAGATKLVPHVADASATAGAKAREEVGAFKKATPVPIPSSWDYTADVVVVGLGGAGCVSAITAAEQGASVIVLEKGPDPGGSTSVASGHLEWGSNAVGCAEYVMAAGLGTITPAVALAIGTQLANMGTWYTNHGVMMNAGEPTTSTPGSDGLPGAAYYNVNSYTLSHDGWPTGVGKDYWQYLYASLEKQSGVQVMCSTPAVHLIQNPANGMILGVQASGLEGEIINVQANKGVIMACGGYENNRDMISRFNNDNDVPMYPAGCPYNTGDGILMTTEVGARLWHMQGFEYGYYGFKPSVFPSAFWLQPGGANSVGGAMNAYIIVNSSGTRFHPESTTWGHIKTAKPEPLIMTASSTTGVPGLWPNYPFYMIFDETIIKQGPVGMTVRSVGDGPYVQWNFSPLHVGYTWSKDNSVEIANGWIVQNSTLAGLAAALNINPTGLQTQVTNWNSYCAAGADTQLGRTASTLAPINNPPYCGIQMDLTLINTQGGAEHDAHNQILDTDGNPIPHLYGAGEFGAYYGFLYTGSNLSENVVDGVIAGTNAAAQAPWSS